MTAAFVWIMSPRGLEPQLRFARADHPSLTEELVPAVIAKQGDCVARHIIKDDERPLSLAEYARKFPAPPLRKGELKP